MPESKGVYKTFEKGTIRAVRYGDADGSWDDEAPSRVAAFILGVDPDSSSTVLNERMWDVVTPVEVFWRPEANVADLEVTDHKRGVRIVVKLGDWVAIFPNGRIRSFTNNDIVGATWPLTNTVKAPPGFEVELRTLINKYSKESESDTPDFVLSEYLIDSLNAYNKAMGSRKVWFG